MPTVSFEWLNNNTTRTTWTCEHGGFTSMELRYWYILDGDPYWHCCETKTNINPDIHMDDYDWSSAIPSTGRLLRVSVWPIFHSDGGWGYDNAAWSRELTVDNIPPSVAPPPDLLVDQNRITLTWTSINGVWGIGTGSSASLTGSDLKIDEMEIVIYDGQSQLTKEYAKVSNNGINGLAVGTIKYEKTLDYGKTYRILYRGVNHVIRDSNGNVTSATGPSTDSTYYGTDPIDFITAPAAPQNVMWNLSSVALATTNYLKVSWAKDVNSSYHIVKYINEQGDFEVSSTVQETQSESNKDYVEISLPGGKYKMRVIGVNNAGEGLPTTIDVAIGVPPQKPTTWTDKNQYIVNSETPTIYWQHCSVDSSRMCFAEVEIRRDRGTIIKQINYENRDPLDWNKNGSYQVPDSFTQWVGNEPTTSTLRSSEKVWYRVRTAGANGKYGEWSNEQSYMRYIAPQTETWIYHGALTQYPSEPDAENHTQVLQLETFPFTAFTNIYEYEKPYTSNPTYTFYCLNPNNPYTVVGPALYDVNYDSSITRSIWHCTTAIENKPLGQNYYNVVAIQPYDIRNAKILILEADNSEGPYAATYIVDNTNQSEDFELNSYTLTGRYFKIMVWLGRTGSSADFSEVPSAVRTHFKLRQHNTPYSAQKVREVKYRLTSSLNYDYVTDYGEPITYKRGDCIYSWSGIPDQDRYWLAKTINYSDLKMPLIPNSIFTLEITATFESGMQTQEWRQFVWNGRSLDRAPRGPITLKYHEEPTYAGDDSFVSTMDISFYWPQTSQYADAKDYECYVYRRNVDGTMTLIRDNIQIGNENSSTDYRIHLCTVTDNHPFIGLNTYVIGARDKKTGITSVTYAQKEVKSDFPIIDFDESWLPYELGANPTRRSRVVINKIYNISINESNTADKEEILFAGRLRKNSYYGTSQTETSSWSFEFPREDKNTLHKLRIMSVHKGPVYIREVNGRGYWANITVTINDTYNTEISTGSFTITVTGGEGA